MLKQELRVGQIVSFGRPNGQKTLGRVLKIAQKTALIESTENRGVTSIKKSGLKYRVPYSFIYPADASRNIPYESYRTPGKTPSYTDSVLIKHPVYNMYVEEMKSRSVADRRRLDEWIEEMEFFDGEMGSLEELEKYGDAFYTDKSHHQPDTSRSNKPAKRKEYDIVLDREALQQQLYEGEDRVEYDELPPPRDGYWTPKENITWFERYVISGRKSYRGIVKDLTCKKFADDLVKYGNMEKYAKNIFFKRIADSRDFVAVIFDYMSDNNYVTTESATVFYHRDYADVPAGQFVLGKTMEGDTIEYMSGDMDQNTFYKTLAKAIQTGLDTIRKNKGI